MHVRYVWCTFTGKGKSKKQCKTRKNFGMCYALKITFL